MDWLGTHHSARPTSVPPMGIVRSSMGSSRRPWAIGISGRRMIDSSFGPDDRAFLERAQLIVLAGGDVRLGWNTFEKTGMKDVILGRYAQGAVLVGISAGAVQLGRYGIVETPGLLTLRKSRSHGLRRI